jgi:hypothetical protein
MKLGEIVRFKVDYIKTGEHIDPDNATEEQTENMVTLTKLKPREHKTFKEGYICGKRQYAIKTDLYFDEQYYNEYMKNRFYSVGSEYETFYLVACNMNGFYKVKEEDLIKQPFPLPF